MKLLTLATISAACLGLLSACGGGDANAPSDPPAVVQGFWSGSVTNGPDSATTASTVVAPDLTAWVVLGNGTTLTGLVKVPLVAAAASTTTVSATGSGHYFKLGTVGRQTRALAGTATTNNQFEGTVGSASFAWTGNATYKTAAKASDLVAAWKGTAGGQTIVYNWALNGSGDVSGSSTSGCSYAGKVQPHATGVALFNVNVTETCAGVNKTFSGIATLNAAKTALNVAYTTAGDAEGGVLQLTKQP